MKLERLNENQIRCTLSKTDLEQRQLRLSELAYGSVKARELFQDMIKQASEELGFEAENIPLMIEAIPISGDCLILVVTKVEDPEELDSRFSHLSKLSDFLDGDEYISPFYDDEDDFDAAVEGDLPFSSSSDEEDESEGPDPLSLIAPFARAIAEAKKQAAKKQAGKEGAGKEEAESGNQTRLFLFRDLDQIITLSSFLAPFYTGDSILYKDEELSHYYLFLKRRDSEPEAFRRACMLASDYGMRSPVSYASLAYCREHCRLLFKEDAIQILNHLN
ncbi:MAG: adaptor protein MecA [Eubacterium sp.]|nr:adaptor protein MecA [Eubacterium sp.]